MWPSLVDLVVQEDLDAEVREAVEVVDVVVETEEDMEVDVEEVMEDVEVHVVEEEDLVEVHVEDSPEVEAEEREEVVEARAMEANNRPTEDPTLNKFNFKSLNVMISLSKIMIRLVLMKFCMIEPPLAISEKRKVVVIFFPLKVEKVEKNLMAQS